MKYSNDEALERILQKGGGIRRARARRRTQLLFAASAALFVALLTAIAVLPGRSAEAPAGSVYGSFLLSMEAGGYVLVGILAFALGAAITLLCVHINKERNKKRTASEKKQKTEE